jgi:hypothetical protein
MLEGEEWVWGNRASGATAGGGVDSLDLSAVLQGLGISGPVQLQGQGAGDGDDDCYMLHDLR